MFQPSIPLYIAIFCFSLLTSYLLFRGAFHFFPKWGLMDNPRPY
jgi:hypothetical protein